MYGGGFNVGLSCASFQSSGKLHRYFRILCKYFVLTVGLTCFFCLLLYLSGLGGQTVQTRINRNVKNSLDQFKRESIYPQIINSKDSTYRLDNYTDSIILQESLLMNTASNPLSIFTNPRVSNTYENSEYHALIMDVEEAVKTNTGNTDYSHYWIGIRSLIRPLLVLLNYQSIRGLIALIFLCLWMMTTISIHQAAGKYLACSFFISVACMNIPIVTSEIQFITCFMVMFAAMQALIRINNKVRSSPLLFFITGACTQFFDYYTYPLMTLCFPLILLIALTRDEIRIKRIAMMCRCVMGWFAAYAAFWLIRLMLVNLFTEIDAASHAFARFALWTGRVPQERYDKFTPLYALNRIADAFLNPHTIFFLWICAVVYIVLLLVHALKKKIHIPSPLYLLVSLLPVLWVCIASVATANHYWFQYRILSVSVFSITAFLADALRSEADAGKSSHSVCKNC